MACLAALDVLAFAFSVSLASLAGVLTHVNVDMSLALPFRKIEKVAALDSKGRQPDKHLSPNL